jgi:hypothetical protein
MRSSGWRWSGGGTEARRAWISPSAGPRRSCSSSRGTIVRGTFNFPQARLMPISHTDAALTKTAARESAIRSRTLPDNRPLSASHEGKAWVSRKRAGPAPCSEASSTSSGVGSKSGDGSILLSGRTTRLARFPFGLVGHQPDGGSPALAMTPLPTERFLHRCGRIRLGLLHVDGVHTSSPGTGLPKLGRPRGSSSDCFPTRRAPARRCSQRSGRGVSWPWGGRRGRAAAAGAGGGRSAEAVRGGSEDGPPPRPAPGVPREGPGRVWAIGHGSPIWATRPSSRGCGPGHGWPVTRRPCPGAPAGVSPPPGRGPSIARTPPSCPGTPRPGTG